MLSSSARARDERALLAGEFAKQLLVDSSVLATVSVSTKGAVLKANRTFRELLKIESATELSGLDFGADVLIDASDWRIWKRAMATGHALADSVSMRIACKPSVRLRGDVWAVPSPDGSVERLFGAFIDITSLQEHEQALHRRIRSDAIDGLASGLIHDFKNLLTVLLGNLYLIVEGVRDDPALYKQAKTARDVAKQGAELIQQLLSLSKSEGFQPKDLDVRKVLAKLTPVLESYVSRQIEFAVEMPENLPAVRANGALLEAAIINLVSNARDAIEGQGNITVKVESRHLALAESRALTIEPGPYVCVAVIDNGPGIPEELQLRVFEPFYSSKIDCGGTGLGLGMVRWFAENHGGTATLRSSASSGTTVSLLLPVSARAFDESEVLTMPLKTLPDGDENVVLLSDEARLSKTIEDSLSILGYVVRSARDLPEAQSLISKRECDLLIIDSSILLERDARDSVERLRASGSCTPMLLMKQSHSDDSSGLQGGHSLVKPFSLKDLAFGVRAALDGGQP
jgi:signal transduction histidine kinase